jgi:hypothetical protein
MIRLRTAHRLSANVTFTAKLQVIAVVSAGLVMTVKTRLNYNIDYLKRSR